VHCVRGGTGPCGECLNIEIVDTGFGLHCNTLGCYSGGDIVHGAKWGTLYVSKGAKSGLTQKDFTYQIVDAEPGRHCTLSQSLKILS
jgi:hypothetical protein